MAVACRANSKKIVAPIGILKRLSYCIPKHLLRTVYFSLIHCHLQYLTLVWFPTRNQTVDQYILSLRQLSKDCEFKAVSAEENRYDYIRFIYQWTKILTNTAALIGE